ncbi:MAG: hypothetical protein P8X65_00065 [Syntrophobacterales bacterium]|jgi:hypothetical protein
MLNFFREYWWIWALCGAAILWGVSLLLVRYWTLKSLRPALRKEVEVDDLELPLPDPQPQDQEALRLLRDYRRRYLLKLWPDTRLSFKEINELSQTLMAEIARIYYPEEERPELKASLADLVSLYRRVGVRLASWMEAAPFRPLKDMELATVLFLHGTYQKIKGHPLHQFLKRHHMYRAARWVWGTINVINPYYWGRQAAYRGGREFLARTFLAKVVTVVGEESIRLYSRRSPNLRLFRRYQVGLQEMINLTLGENGALPAEVAAHLLKSILKARGLEDQEKVILLQRLSRPRRRDTALVDLEPEEQQEVQGWLEGAVKTCWEGAEQKEHLAQVRERWQEIETGTEPEE